MKKSTIIYEDVKTSIKERAMQLWGVDNPDNLDPLILLMMEVFAYEIAKLHDKIKVSDAKLIERISKVLVNQNWSLPTPTHSLLQITPTRDDVTLNENSSFYLNKFNYSKKISELYFTPLYPIDLLRAKIEVFAYDRRMSFLSKSGAISKTIRSLKDDKIEDYTVYVSINIDDYILDNLKEIPLTLFLDNSPFEDYIKLCEVYDMDDNKLSLNQIPERPGDQNIHYYNSIKNNYKNFVYTLDIEKSSKKKHKVNEVLGSVFSENDVREISDKNLYWLKFKFPVAFIKDELDQLKITLNTFPVVNRRLIEKSLNLLKNGRILSLESGSNEFFLEIKDVIDDKGYLYDTILNHQINDLQGAYSVYFGNVEQFDERTAKSMLNQMVQAVREEGSSFSSVGYERLNAYLHDLNEQLHDMEVKFNSGYKDVVDFSNRPYLMLMPKRESQNVVANYWITNAHLANSVEPYTKLMAEDNYGLDKDSIVLQTTTFGGTIKTTEKDTINSLRYGLISKDRIVSREDVKNFIRKSIGDLIDDIEVKSGVGISEHKKQGLIRTTDVIIRLNQKGSLTVENKNRLSHIFKNELEEKSILTMPYKVTIQ